MKTEEFPIDEEKLDQLIDVLHRKKQTLQGDGGYVYVNLSMVRLQIMWVLPKILYAMGVAEAMGARVIVLTWRENALFDRLAEALGVEHVVLEKIDHGDPAALFKAGLKSAFWLAGNSRGESFQKVRIMGIPVGQFIYEDILRTSSLSTIRSIRNKICI
ncbi:MAG: hypothetical protein IJ600_10785 [Lachnospiraceae bacterium]|nr:hypothetical protein [Lachnospiraceae bacterium]